MIEPSFYQAIGNAIKGDLYSPNEMHQGLALGMIGSTAPEELIDLLKDDIEKLTFGDSFKNVQVRKKAILTCLRMYRKYQQKFDVSKWIRYLGRQLEEKSWTLGLTSSAASAILGVANEVNANTMEDFIQPIVIELLKKFVIHKECNQFYLYYETPNPWLQVKLLKLLQVIQPPSNFQLLGQLLEILTYIVKHTQVTKVVNKNNTDHGILFETINLIIYYGKTIPEKLRNEAITLLGIFITVREPNIRYLALETICKFHKTEYSEKVIAEHCITVLHSLKDQDISIRRRALDILYLMCTQQLAPRIVAELLNYVSESDLNFKEELVLKVAILAEKFAGDLEWYIDVVIKLISTSGEFVTNEIWYRIIQIITGFGKDINIDLQKYAAIQLYNAVQFSHVHDTLVKVASYILAEYSHLIIESGRSSQKIFETLNKHFISSSESTRAMLLTSYTKLGCKHPEILDQIQQILIQQSDHYDPDIQQRGIEYQIVVQEGEQIRNKIFEAMPTFALEIKDNNPLLKSMMQLKLGLSVTQASASLQKLTSIQLEPTMLNEIKKQTEKEIAEAQESILKSQSEKSIHQKEQEVQEWIKQIQEHPAYSAYSSFILTIPFNLIASIPRLSLAAYSNSNMLTSLIASPTGIIYKSDSLQINYTSEFDQYLGRIAMQFVGNVSEISIQVQQTNGILFNISTVMTETIPNQVMMQVMCVAPEIDIPVAMLQFKDENNGQQQINFAVPILATKFISATIIPEDILKEHYQEYSIQSKPIYFKLDRLLKNPSPAFTTQVMEKITALLQTIGFHSYVSKENDYSILAAGQFFFKLENGTGDVQNYPVMINIVTKQEANEWIYCGIRVGGSGEIAKSLFQVIELIVNPQM